MKDIWINKYKNRQYLWSKPKDYHVTVLYTGRNEEIAEESQIYRDFEEDVEVDVEVRALLVAPDKIMTGVVFTKHAVENSCPHLTLMINQFAPKHSNDLLEACFTRGRKPLADVYNQLKTTGKVSADNEVRQVEVSLNNKSPSFPCFFIALDEPVTFKGVTKIYY